MASPIVKTANQFIEERLPIKPTRLQNVRTHKDIFAPAFWRCWNDVYNKRVGTVSCSGGRGCVSGRTVLLTPNGGVKAKDFTGGDVFAVTEHGITAVPACRALKYAKVPMFRVTLTSGATIEVTDEHRFLSDDGWKMLKDLNPGDHIYCGDTFFLSEEAPDDRIGMRRILALFYTYWHDHLQCGFVPPPDDETYLDVLLNLSACTYGKWNEVVADAAATVLEVVEKGWRGPEFNLNVADLIAGEVRDETFSDALACCAKYLRRAEITQIEYIGDEWYYDLFVPFYNNYITEGGFVNHNSTKSSFVSMAILMRMEMARRQALAAKKAGVKEWRKLLTHAACFRKVAGTLGDSVYTEFYKAATRLGIVDKYYFKKTPLTIIRNGTQQRIYFRGLDDPMKARSIATPFSYISDLWFEELSEYDGIEEIQDVTRSIQRGGHEFMTFYSYNPPETSSNWVNYVLAELEEKDPTFRQYRSDYRTVPKDWLGEKFFRDAEILRQMNERAYRHIYLGEITGNGGTVFPNVKLVDIPDSEIAKFDNVFFGADFGLRDPTVLLASHYDAGPGIVTIFDEVYKPDMTLDEIVFDFMNLYKRCGTGMEYIMGDSASAQLIVSLRSRGVPIIPVEKYGDFRMMTTKWLQSLREIRIVKRRAPNAYREFINTEYEKNKAGEFTGRIPDGNDHTVDSCLVGNTIVHTTKGDYEIRELVGREGLLETYDEATGVFRTARFCNVRKTRENAETVTIKLEDGLSVSCTRDHKFLEKAQGWIPAAMLECRLQTGHSPRIKTEFGWSKVISITPDPTPSDVYDLEVPETHNFAINGGIVSHNCRYSYARTARYYSPWD